MIPIAKVIVSPTEPTGKNRKKVWMQKGKNLLDKNLLIFNKFINGNDGTIMTSASNNYYATEKYIPFNQYVGKTITISKTMAIAFYDSNQTFISLNEATDPRQVVVPSKTEYIRVEVHKDNYNVAQIEQGPNATEYEEYVEPKIYIKNSNDVYDEFINKKELENKINNMQYLSILGSVGDNETKTFPVNSGKVYLYINSHVFQRCIILISIFNDTIVKDIIYKSSDTAIPTISLNSSELTIKSEMQCRGKLIRLNNLICA